MASAGDEIRRALNVFGPIPNEIRRELRPALRKVAGAVLVQARKNADYSTRIPGAMRLTTSFANRTAGVAITVSKAKAPNARPLENLGRQGLIRHPTYGRPDSWVTQRAHPALFPAVATAEPELVAETGVVVERVFRKHGFR